jgi:hypothetical protein
MSSIYSRYSLKTHIKKKLMDNFNYVISNPPEEHLNELHTSEHFNFKFNNKSFAAYIDIPRIREFYNDFYKEIGTAYIYGLYNLNKEKDTENIIGSITLLLRHDNRIWQILDLKIKKDFQGIKCVNTLLTATLPIRILKNTGYYIISMNPNPRVDIICSNMKMTKMKPRGKMLIFIVSFENVVRMLSYLQIFYSSDIGFVNNNNKRIWMDATNKKEMKILHLHHNSLSRQFDFREPQIGYEYCFAIHESHDFIIKGLKDDYNVEPLASANIFTNNFKADWSKFVKTSEI